MKVSSFKELLREMDLIGDEDESWDYFAEDFDPDEEGLISQDRFDEDMREIIPHINNLILNVFSDMDGYCKNEYQKRSLKEEFFNI